MDSPLLIAIGESETAVSQIGFGGLTARLFHYHP